ncbi:hypothetical protein ACU19_02500 [Actinobaculum suis]|nr:hypothetical protein ACU19_02500 [Actinobaculum suis]
MQVLENIEPRFTLAANTAQTRDFPPFYGKLRAANLSLWNSTFRAWREWEEIPAVFQYQTGFAARVSRAAATG